MLSLGILIIYKITLLIFCSEYEVQLYFQDHILNNHEAESKIKLTFLFLGHKFDDVHIPED